MRFWFVRVGSSMGEAGGRDRALGPTVVRVLRRMHLYLGLFMVPWVLLFGLTAISFNHPGTFRSLKGRLVPPGEFQALSGFSAWDEEKLAGELVHELSEKGHKLKLEPGTSQFRGWALFSRHGETHDHMVIVGLDRGLGFLSSRPHRPLSTSPPFAGETVSLPHHNSAALAVELEPLHKRLGISEAAPLKPHPEVHPELRFVATDEAGTRWNVVHDLTTGKVDARPSSEPRRAAAIELFESLHKQHHFPPTFGPTTVWALFSDLMAATLLFWGVSGLVMAWQLRKLRYLAVSVLVVGLAVGGALASKTAQDLTFGPER
jgi:hypothetical protein